MNPADFQSMWNEMQRQGYFERSHVYPHAANPFQVPPENEITRALRQTDFSSSELEFPVPFSGHLERAVVQTESHWLPQLVKLPVDGLAVDLGCGYGRSVAWMSECFARVIGVDVSPFIIEKARTTFHHVSNVEFHVSGPDSLPAGVPDGQVAFLYAFTVFQHIHREYTAAYIRQARQKLRPGGLLVFNLLSGMNEDLNTGAVGTEWAIGYSAAAASAMVAQAGLSLQRTVRWRAAGTPASWLWVVATRSSA